MFEPEKYETNKSVAARDAAEFVPKIIDLMQWRNVEKVLDYGCGAGSTGYNLILPQVEKFDSHLYSVDISEKMLTFARNKYSHSRITYAEGNILENFPFEGIRFDKIFAVYVLHFIDNISYAMKKFYEILNPGGSLGFTVAPKTYFFKAIRVLGESDRWKNLMKGYMNQIPDWINYEEDTGYQTFTSLLEESGFQIIHLEVQKRCFPFPNIDTLLEFYMSLIPSIENIPKDLLPILKQDLRKLVTGFANIPLESDKITSRYEFVYAVVQKPMSFRSDNC